MMPRETPFSLNEKEFIVSALQQGVRLDNRPFDQFRELSLAFGDEHGAVDVSIGKTRILARVSATVAAPFPDRPFDGIFTLNIELSPMASPSFEPGRPSEQEILLSRHLEKSIRRSNALDTESLCLLAGRACWSILCTLHVISSDGNLQDCACIAAVAALKHFRRPDISIEGEQVTVYTMAERVPVPLSILHTPISISFAFLRLASDAEEDETLVIMDPTLAEENVKSTGISITANGQGEICHIAQLGGEPVDAVMLLNCSEVAIRKAREVGKWLEGRLRADLEKRDGKAQNEGRAVDQR